MKTQDAQPEQDAPIAESASTEVAVAENTNEEYVPSPADAPVEKKAPDPSPELAALREQLDALTGREAELVTALAALRDDLAKAAAPSEREQDLATQVGALKERIEAWERTPIGRGPVLNVAAVVGTPVEKTLPGTADVAEVNPIDGEIETLQAVLVKQQNPMVKQAIAAQIADLRVKKFQ